MRKTQNPPYQIKQGNKIFKKVREYQYRYPSGKLVTVKVRYEDGAGDKTFRFFHWEENGDIKWTVPPAQQLPPLNAIKIHKYIGCPILIVEGEKAATCRTVRKLEQFGIMGTCFANGASKADLSVMMDHREIFYWPDHDRPGYLKALDTVKALPWAKIIKPPREWSKGDDLADHEWSAENLLWYMEESENWINRECLEELSRKPKKRATIERRTA